MKKLFVLSIVVAAACFAINQPGDYAAPGGAG